MAVPRSAVVAFFPWSPLCARRRASALPPRAASEDHSLRTLAATASRDRGRLHSTATSSRAALARAHMRVAAEKRAAGGL